MIPYTKESYKLLHEGSLALAEMESNGIRIDENYLNKAIRKTERKIQYSIKELESSKIYKEWKIYYKNNLNLNSCQQLGKILFEVMGFKTDILTPTGKYSTDEKSLRTIKHPFIKKYMEIRKLQNVLSTYLVGLKKEIMNGYIHPFSNLHTVQTYRSSSNSPNFQNIPMHDPKVKKLVRQAFVPRPWRHLVEVDYSGIEIRVSACYHQDPRMIEYIKDNTKDMHRDMAMECYVLKKKQTTEVLRQCGKSLFVFPQFYGDWYIGCSKGLWNVISELKLETAQGIPLKKHLKKKGINRLGKLNPKLKPEKGTLEYHIQKVEHDFWNKRFKIYNQWKKDWYNEYESKGWFLTKTGFICQGFMKKNEVLNYPIQGSAFHCLLQSLIWLNKSLKKYKMKTLVVGQIHDSILADVPKNELQNYNELAQEIMVLKLKKKWKWIIVPLEIEIESSPLNGSWADKKGI